MTRDKLQDIAQCHIDDGGDPDYWWDESRIPLDSIDKRVTDLLDLSGKRAVVVGGAGLNLGQACVNRLAGLGAVVAVVDMSREQAEESGHQRWRTPPNAEKVAEQAANRWDADVFAVHGDATDWDSIQAFMAECNDRMGGIDILVNSAADTAAGDFAAMSRADIDRSVRGTLLMPLYCTRAAMDYMVPQGKGVIINVGSEAANSAMPGIELYGTLKAGVNAFTKFVGKQAAMMHGIRILGVNPGSMWGPDREPAPEVFSSLYPRSRTAIQRWELPEEVANMIAFLASDAATAMVGTMVDMGGGMSL